MDHPPPILPLQQGDAKLAIEDPGRSPIDYKPILRDGIAYPAPAGAQIEVADRHYDYAQEFQAFLAEDCRQAAEAIDDLNRQRAGVEALNNYPGMVQPPLIHHPVPVYQPLRIVEPAPVYQPALHVPPAPAFNPALILRPLVIGELFSTNGIRTYSIWAHPNRTSMSNSVMVNITNHQLGMPFVSFHVLSWRLPLELLRQFLDVASTGTQDFLLCHMNLSHNRFDLVISTAKHWDELRLAAFFL